MSKINCLVVDDEPNAGKLLQDYIDKVPYLQMKGICFDGIEALNILHHKPVDLLFLDINMPGLTGMELINVLPKEQHIIFTTAYSEYALESYEYNVIDYLLKPVSFKRFMKAVSKAVQIIGSKESNVTEPGNESRLTEYIFVKSDKKLIRIHYKEILFFEAMKEYISINTATQRILMYKRMKALSEQLPDHFIRVHNSYIINCHYISKVEGNHVIINNVNIPLSSTYKESFMEYIQSRAL